MDIKNRLSELCQEADITADAGLIASLSLHWQLLTQANSKFNLTAITDPEIATSKHYLDCLLASKLLGPYLEGAASAADIGSGGGFPGLIMAAALPQAAFTLIESAQKKAAFLQECAAEMALASLSVLPLRAEEAGRQADLRGNFDLVTARAVAELSVLCEYALPLLKEGGIFAAMKGPKAEEELANAKNALDLLGGFVEQTLSYHLPTSNDIRCLIIIKKSSPTPDKYPRRPGMPLKRPL